ncbi:MFS transporter [Microbacterium protaetiae]|uniref:MFS transporter n=1 Tax=Microbacterium protaetiae TaxID=2509458 RepID=UPI001A92E204|nr:MFS transporter [Microbacterium protaetiae]
MRTQHVGAVRPWAMLGVAVLAQAAGTVFQSAPAFLIPLLHTQRGVPLAQAGLLASAPTLGLVLTLVAWGALTDRVGERWVIAGGMALTALAALGAVFASGYLGLGGFLLLGGAASASTNAASGRVVVGWFPKNRRGLAMGIRQMCQPLGVAVAALAIPPLAASGGVGAAMVLPLVLTAVLAVASAVLIIDPPRPARAATPTARPANPYRSRAGLVRIHVASALLVVPQFTVSIFGLIWLTADRGMTATAAGVVVGVSQFIGALGRVAIGMLSDRVNSRLRPLRHVAWAAAAVMVLLGVSELAPAAVGVAALIVAAAVTVADNGLAYTAVAEIAGPFWSGRALGTQNTGQFLAASIVGPAVGGLITLVGFPLAFAAVALAPVVAVPIIPREDTDGVDAAGPDAARVDATGPDAAKVDATKVDAADRDAAAVNDAGRDAVTSRRGR